jgi:hypothetical protein
LKGQYALQLVFRGDPNPAGDRTIHLPFAAVKTSAILAASLGFNPNSVRRSINARWITVFVVRRMRPFARSSLLRGTTACLSRRVQFLNVSMVSSVRNVAHAAQAAADVC